MAHQVGPRAQALIKSFEGCKLHSYMPTPNDRPTIGYGATFHADGTPVRMGEVWTQAQADEAFARDINKYGAKVAALLGDDPTTPAQFGAMVALAYNIGLGAFARSTVLRKHREGKFGAAADSFLLWTKQAGKVLAGLVRRRNAERALYLS